jgi:hypothetical protein
MNRGQCRPGTLVYHNEYPYGAGEVTHNQGYITVSWLHKEHVITSASDLRQTPPPTPTGHVEMGPGWWVPVGVRPSDLIPQETWPYPAPIERVWVGVANQMSYYSYRALLDRDRLIQGCTTWGNHWFLPVLVDWQASFAARLSADPVGNYVPDLRTLFTSDYAQRKAALERLAATLTAEDFALMIPIVRRNYPV